MRDVLRCGKAAVPCWPARGPGAYHRRGKRALDLVLVLGTVPLWGPVLAVLWALAWCETGAGFYRDPRVGQGGRRFDCIKIRTMYRGAARDCAALKPCCDPSRDPRVTVLGGLLRRSSLDEVPQLWCVLKGEMSLVGPRPVPEAELARYGALRGIYVQMRPGVSGLWQVSGRNALSYGQRVALDAEYWRRCSLWMDLRILCATLWEVLRLGGR